MAFPRRPSRTPRSRYTLALLLLTAVTLLVLDLPGTGPLDPVRSGLAAVFRPVRSAGSTVFRPVTNGWKGAFGYGDVKKENDRLRARLAEDKSQAARVAQLKRELADAQKTAGITAVEARTKTAEVTSGPISSFDHTIEISLGSSDGVKKGMAVIAGGTAADASGGQLLGRIVATTHGSSTVELLTEPSFAVGIRLKDNNLATAQGQGRNKVLVANGIPADSKAKRGDVVDTSGLPESAFPKLLQVGRVARVRRSADGNSKTIEIRPTADLNSVYVKVVLKEASG